MTDLDRLEAQARDNDTAAARALLREANRINDLRLAGTAAAHIDDLDVFADIGGQLWDDGHLDRLTELAAAWGIVLDQKTASRLDAIRDEEHGRRTARLLTHSQILAAMVDARHHADRFGFRHAGAATSSPTHPQTTVCLAWLSPAEVIEVGIAEAGAVTPSPGRGWRELQPWRRFEMENNLARLPAWADAAHENVTRVRICEPTAPIPPEAPPASAMETLEELLAADHNEKAFRAILRFLNKWPKGDKAAFPGALRKASIVLQDWPLTTRVAKRAWMKRAIKNSLRATDRLIQYVELEKMTSEELTDLAGSEALETISAAVLRPDVIDVFSAESLAALGSSDFAGKLRRLYVSVQGAEAAGLLTGQGLTGLKTLWLYSHSAIETVDGFEKTRLPALEDLYGFMSVEATQTLLQTDGLPSLRRLWLRFGLNNHPGRDQANDGQLDEQRTAIGLALANSPLLETVRWLRCGSLGDAGVEAFCKRAEPSALETLVLEHSEVTAPGVAAICQSRFASQLRELRLDRNEVGDEGAAALASTPFEQLEWLSLDGPTSTFNRPRKKIGSDGARALASADWLRRVRFLMLPLNDFEDDVLAELLATPMPNLEVLNLAHTGVGPKSAAAIANNASLNGLCHLILKNNQIGDGGLVALTDSTHLTSLESLDVRDCELGSESAVAIAESAGLPALRQLLLDGNELDDAGIIALAESDGLARLDWISLHQAGVRKKGKAALAVSSALEGRYTGIPGYSAADRERTLDQLRARVGWEAWCNGD